MSNKKDPSVERRLSSSGTRPSTRRTERSRHSEGELIGDRYRLGRQLGEGGMGEVWLAHNETLDIDVAVKVIRAAEEDNRQEYTDRLLQEARAAARLGHPAIVRVNDFGKTAAGEPFIVMELLQGEDLADSLAQRGRLGAVKAVRTILPIAHALTAAHAQGIIHRDIKPENIFLSKSEGGQLQPKLVDFGVAKLEITQSIRPADTGSMLGSPLYMSPEQARGDDVDHRADVWSLAVVLYEMITGRQPFEAKNYNAVLYSIIANPVAPTTELGSGDADLWAILDRALQKDPDRRWYSMRDFGEALATWLRDKDVSEDISGASLQTTWFHWNQSTGGDALNTGPPAPDPASDAPMPDIPPPPMLPGRSREITVRRDRAARGPTTLWVAGAVIAVCAIIAIVVATRSNQRTVINGEPSAEEQPPSVKILSDEEVARYPEMDQAPVEEERASDPLEESAPEPALAASALPVAADEEPARPPTHRSGPVPDPSASRQRTRPPPTRKEIVTRDPYE